MRKILIVARHMQIGGIQKSLIELLKMLAKREDYAVTLFCCTQTGELRKQIPENIRVLNENPYAWMTEHSVAECRKKGLRYAVCRAICAIWSKLFGKRAAAFWVCKLIGNIGDEYDAVISYAQPLHDRIFCGLTNEIVLHCCNAKQKIGYIHCDFGSYGGNTAYNRKLYLRFDKIVCVTQSVKQQFAKLIPQAQPKLHTVYNNIDADAILSLSTQDPVIYNKPCFVTVARLGEEKGHLRCIPVFAKLKEEGFDFCWHIIGDGEMKPNILDAIAQYQLQEHIFLQGQQINPYRYMKYANFFLFPSFHEAAGIVIYEAQLLGLPVLATDILSAQEMIKGKNCGFICDNTSQGIYTMLKQALQNKLGGFEQVNPPTDQCKQQFDSLFA